MRVPFRWLIEYCDPKVGPQELATRLAMTGTEIERVLRFGVTDADSNEALFQVGKVVGVEKHPDADRLKVCTVDLGESEPRTVVCGAANVAVGQTVAVALPGAVIADGTKLKEAEIRGVRSAGMILSEQELGLSQDSQGIMVLPDSSEIGVELASELPFADWILELEVTPNRPDCFGVYGVAREVHAVTNADLVPHPGLEQIEPTASGDIKDLIEIEVQDSDLCPRFTARAFLDVEVGPSPLWLKARLAALGQRSINNVVDITNYVMFMIGQPMHAYDLDKIAGAKLIVRRADEHATLETLDGEVRAFDPEIVLVYDASGPSGIGGIMGGKASEVTGSTTRVVLEAANWVGTNILKSSSSLGVRSEASTRFEKQLHPALTLQAQEIAGKLMVELCAAKFVPGTVDIASEPEAAEPIKLRSEKVVELLGEGIAEEQCVQILERLGFIVEPAAGVLIVNVPAERYYDVRREADLIEEIARVHGLERLPATLPARREAVGGLSPEQKLRRQIEDLLRDLGHSEVISWSFLAPDFVDRLRLPSNDLRRKLLQLENPLSEDQSAMRTTLLPGLLDAACQNISVNLNQVRIFESGRIFLSRGQDELATEHHHIAALLTGIDEHKSWRHSSTAPDFYSAKGVLEAALVALGQEWRLADGGPAFLHPGKAAQVLSHGHECGWIGEVHPLVSRAWAIDQPVVAFELNLTELLERIPEPMLYRDVITYPAVYQDIAVIVEGQIEAQSVVDVVRAAASDILTGVQIFDLYRGEQVAEGSKSLALRLEFRSSQGTLTEQEVSAMRKMIAESLEKELGAVLRV